MSWVRKRIEGIAVNLIEKVATLYDCEISVLYDDNLDVKSIATNTLIKLDAIANIDLPEIMHFKDIVNTYLKMDKMLAD